MKALNVCSYRWTLVHHFNHNPSFANFLVAMKVPAECTHFRRFHWAFVLVDPPPIKLFHLGKEVDGMLSLLEDRWDDLMTFDPQLFGQAGAVPSYTSDPSQKVGIRSTMPKSTPPKKLEQIQNQESESVYKFNGVLSTVT